MSKIKRRNIPLHSLTMEEHKLVHEILEIDKNFKQFNNITVEQAKVLAVMPLEVLGSSAKGIYFLLRQHSLAPLIPMENRNSIFEENKNTKGKPR
jgi:hypothetical protein